MPHTFDLLERVDPSVLPHTLRYITQAGGRMAPEAVRRWVQRGAEDGWDMVVMYGQTEATARMAYLPPALAATRPNAVGVAIDGGSFEVVVDDAHGIRPAAVGEVGRIRYRGPNVMMGYAETADDLASGPGVDELDTGDLGRIAPDGLLEITGRASRFIKPLGLRVDLDRVDARLRATVATDGIEVWCTGDDNGLVVATSTPHPRLAATAAQVSGLPPAAVRLVVLDELPRRDNGKPDLPAVLARARSTQPDDEARPGDDSPAAIVARALGVPAVDPARSFVELGGDSLTFVEASVRLEEQLGVLPAGWHHRPLESLRPTARRRFVRPLDTAIALRGLAILMVVSTHAGWFSVPAGAHVMLAIAGWNFARFQLRSDHMLRSIGRIALPSMAFIALLAAVDETFFWHHALLITHVTVGSGVRWSYWFIEALVLFLLVAWAALRVPAIRRLEQRAPFGFPLALLAAGLLVRWDVVPASGPEHPFHRPETTGWLFALGWAGARADRTWQRLLISAIAVAALPSYFDMADRELRVAAGILLLVWLPTVWVPAAVHRTLVALAGASLGIYLVHYVVLMHLEERTEVGAVAVSLAAGVALWHVLQRATLRTERFLRSRSYES